MVTMVDLVTVGTLGMAPSSLLSVGCPAGELTTAVADCRAAVVVTVAASPRASLICQVVARLMFILGAIDVVTTP